MLITISFGTSNGLKSTSRTTHLCRKFESRLDSRLKSIFDMGCHKFPHSKFCFSRSLTWQINIPCENSKILDKKDCIVKILNILLLCEKLEFLFHEQKNFIYERIMRMRFFFKGLRNFTPLCVSILLLI